MGQKSLLHVYACRSDDDWIIEVGGNCHFVAQGEWE